MKSFVAVRVSGTIAKAWKHHIPLPEPVSPNVSVLTGEARIFRFFLFRRGCEPAEKRFMRLRLGLLLFWR
jgi:hypothetical protein